MTLLIQKIKLLSLHQVDLNNKLISLLNTCHSTWLKIDMKFALEVGTFLIYWGQCNDTSNWILKGFQETMLCFGQMKHPTRPKVIDFFVAQ
jgi:hypothetical protein